MKMSVALLSSLSLAVVLVGCQHKGAHKGGSGDNAADAEPVDDSEDGDKTVQKKTVTKKPADDGDKTKTDPNTGAGDDVAAKPEALCLKADDSICKIEQRILELMNKERAAPTKGGGLFGGGGTTAKAPMTNGKKLAVIAREWSVVQGKRGSIGHDGFPNQRSQAYQQEFNARASITGENVAMFGGSGSSVEEVAQQFYQMWYNSPGHYKNMMGNFKSCGVGVAEVDGSWWATQVFGAE